MPSKKFDQRLKRVQLLAAIRLEKRIKFAYAHGYLTDYLLRIGLSPELSSELDEANFKLTRLIVAAQAVLQDKISRARQKGYLKDYLKKINMLDLLMHHKHIRTT